MNNTFEAVFLGANGSCAFNNGQRTQYGTNTSCVVVKAGEHTLILDAGTGLCGYHALTDFQTNQIHVFLSHYHADHLSGLLFWKDLFDQKKEIIIYGPGDVRAALDCFLDPLFSPVGLENMPAKLTFHTVKDSDSVYVDCVTVTSKRVSHPGGCMGYRIEYGGRVMCHLTDIELSEHENDHSLVAFAEGADLLIADASFANGKNKKGWGHSTPEECAKLAKQAGVKRLALYHYDHGATDADIAALEKDARLIFPESFAPSDGFRIAL